MLMKRWTALACAVLALSLYGAWAADISGTASSSYDVSDGTLDLTASVANQQDPSWKNASITLSSPNTATTVTIGGAGQQVTLNLGTVKFLDDTYDSTLNIDQASSKGSTITLGSLIFTSSGSVNLNAAAAGEKNNLIVNNMTFEDTAPGGNFKVATNSRLTVNTAVTVGATATSGFNLTLDGGEVEFKQGMTADNAFIFIDANAAAINNVAFGGDSGLVMEAGEIELDGKTLNVVKSLDGSGFANVILGGGGIGIDLKDTDTSGGTLIVGTLTLKSDVEFSVETDTGKLNADGLIVDVGATNTFADVAGVVTTVKEGTSVKTGTYQVAGTNNVYEGGIAVEAKAILRNTAANDSILVGSDSANLGIVNLNGGTLSSAGGAFTVQASRFNVTGKGTAFDTTGGVLHLETADIIVNAKDAGGNPLDVEIAVGENLLANSYTQTNGIVTVNDLGAGKLVTSKETGIGGGTRETQFIVNGDTVDFAGGMTVGANGAVMAGASAGTISVGFVTPDPVARDVILAGGAKLSGGATSLTLKDATAGLANPVKGRVRIGNTANVIEGDVGTSTMDVVVQGVIPETGETVRISGGTANNGFKVNSFTVEGGKAVLGSGVTRTGILTSAGDVVVKDGGALASEFATASINSTKAESVLRVDKGGFLTAETGGMTAAGFANVAVNGSYAAGWNGVASTFLSADSAIAIAEGALVGVTEELAMNAKAGTDETDSSILMQVTSVDAADIITNNANMQSRSMFGFLDFGLSADQRTLYVAGASRQIAGTYTPEDIALATGNLKDMWGGQQIHDDLGSIIYNASVLDTTGNYGLFASPAGNAAGVKNSANFQALASPDGQTVGRDTLEFMNGAHNSGVNQVAINTSRLMMNEMYLRARNVNHQVHAVRDAEPAVASETASPNSIINSSFVNRFYAGGFGLWEDTDTKGDFSGYQYDSYGFITGYDRMLACNVALGMSFAYNKGLYEDKGAAEHDSEIESYSFGLYGTYSASSGFFATLFGGYTYSDNNINELRFDPSVAGHSWAAADYHNDTWSGGLALGYDIRPSECLTVSPSIGFNYINSRNSDHDAWLGGVRTQRERGIENHAAFLPIELGAQYEMLVGCEGKLRLDANVGYAYNFNRDGIDGVIDYRGLNRSVSASVRSRDAARHSVKAGVGFRYAYRQFDAGVKYDYVVQSRYDAHRLMGTVGVSF